MKKLPILGFIGVIIIICIGCYVASITTNMRVLAQANLTYYKPTVLPDGINIVSKTLYEQKYQSGGDPFGKTLTNTSVTLGYRTVDNVYSIQEVIYSADKRQALAVKNPNYDPTSVKPTCKRVTTPARKSYRLCHWIDYGKYNVFETKFYINDEFINSQMETKIGKTLTEKDLSAFVDSFVKGDPSELKLNSYTGGP